MLLFFKYPEPEQKIIFDPQPLFKGRTGIGTLISDTYWIFRRDKI
jgi:hypothetical protein